MTSRPLFTPGKDPVRIVQEAGWAAGPVWTGAENLAPTGIRSPDRPARSQSLYRLRYPADVCCNTYLIYFIGCRHYFGTVAGKVVVFLFITKRCHIGSVEFKLHVV